METIAENNKRRPLRWLAAALVLLLVSIALFAAAAWVFRMSFAESYLARYCDQRGLECQAEFKQIGLNSAEIDELIILSNGREVLRTGAINASYSWPRFLSPAVESVTINQPVLNAGFDGTRLDLGGLDKLASGEDGGGDPINVTIKDGRIVLVTPAGELSGMVNVSGALPQSGEALIKISPAQLQSGTDRLVWTKGEATLAIAEGRVTGTAEVEIDQALLGELNVQAAVFEATLAGEEDAPVIQWNGTAENLGLGDRRLTGVKTHGEAYLSDLPDGGIDKAMQSLQRIAGEVTAETVNLGGIASEAMSLNSDLSRAGSNISGPIAFTAKSVSTLTGLAQQASASGRLELNSNDPGSLEFSGSGVLKAAAIYAPRRRAWLEGVGLPEPFSAHGAALHTALDNALASFDSGADIEFSRKGDRWRLTASRPTALTAASGMTISIEPSTTPQWLQLSNNGLLVSGEVVASGGGGPTLRSTLNSAAATPDQLSIDAAVLELEPWTEMGRTLSVKLRPFQMESASGQLRVGTKGDVMIAGAFPGVALKDTTLSGGFEATRGAEGWRIQTGQSACLDLKTDGAGSDALSLDPVALKICPEDGRFVRSENGKPTGTLALGDIRLPFKTRDSQGALNFTDSVMDWQLGKSLRAEIKSRALLAPITLGERQLKIDARDPLLTLETGDGPFQFAASLGNSTFDGDLIPAKVSSAGFEFAGSVPETGFTGELRSNDVRIEDYRDDPIYTPIRADLSATIKDGRIVMTGPLRLQRSGWTIAEARMDLGLSDLSGTASLSGRELQFEPGRLQPHDLSDLLRPVLPNARGTMKGNADFTITHGDLAGTGNVSFSDLSFDTFRLGTISGVSGSVSFSDILDLTTLPDQIVSVGMIDPGVPLQNGRIAFQLVDGRLLQLQGARWPFAGGELVVAPTSWEVGGKTELVTITAEKLELNQLTEALSLKEIKAQGTVSGSFPLEIIGPDAFLRGAVLTADERGGKLGYTGSGLDSAKGYGEFTDHAVDAIKALDFEVLELRADGNIAGEIIVGLKLLGRNADVLSGQPFEYNINVTSELAQLIRSARTSLSSTVIIDQVKEQILENAGVSVESE